MDLNSLYVIAYWMKWTGMSLNSNTVYCSKEEAEEKISELQKSDFAINQNFNYLVLSLDEYIREAKEQAANEVRYPIE